MHMASLVGFRLHCGMGLSYVDFALTCTRKGSNSADLWGDPYIDDDDASDDEDRDLHLDDEDESDDEDGEYDPGPHVIGRAFGRLIRRDAIRSTFWSAMEEPSEDTSYLGFEIFDR